MAASNESRQDLCECLEDALGTGIFNFRFRFLRQDGTIRGLSIHGFRNHFWECLDIRASDDVTSGLWKRLVAAADRDTTEKWTCHRVDHKGQTDFEVSFPFGAVARELAEDVESSPDKYLFHDHKCSREVSS